MGLLTRETEISGDKFTGQYDVLFDTGARSCVVRKEIAERLASLVPLKESKDFGTAKEGVKLTSGEVVILNLQLNGLSLDGRFYVVPELSRDIIVGADFLQNWGIILDPREETLTVGVDPHNIELI